MANHKKKYKNLSGIYFPEMETKLEKNNALRLYIIDTKKNLFLPYLIKLLANDNFSYYGRICSNY